MGNGILVTGATGNVGEQVVRLLQQRQEAFTITAHDLPAARQRWGDEVACVAFDFLQPETYAAAFAGQRAVFLIRPPTISDVKRYINPAVDAAVQAGVAHIVFLSLLGVEKNAFVPHHKIEAHLLASGIAYTFLRASFFMQNLSTTHREDIARHDEIFVPAGHGKMSSMCGTLLPLL